MQKKEKEVVQHKKILTGEIGSRVRSTDHQDQQETEESPEVIHGQYCRTKGSAVLTAGRCVEVNEAIVPTINSPPLPSTLKSKLSY